MSSTTQTYRIKIDDTQYKVDDPVLTGRQLLNLADKSPVEEHLIYHLGPDNLLEDIGLEETIDLREAGRERFLTFKSDRSFRFELDSQRQDWGAPKISESTLRKLAGVGPEYRVWLEQRDDEDRKLALGEIVDLSGKGVERFFTGRDDTTAGVAATGQFLPHIDQGYLHDRGIAFKECVEGGQKAILLKAYPLPHERYEVDHTDILIVLPPGYPDAAPDMFYCDPWLKLSAGGQYPPKADQPFQFQGRRWQRWSRHNHTWRCGVDGIHTMLRRVDRALRGDQ